MKTKQISPIIIVRFAYYILNMYYGIFLAAGEENTNSLLSIIP